MTDSTTLLPLLKDERIFYISRADEGFVLTEGCDDYFSVNLSAEQLYKLGEEIIALSGHTRAQAPAATQRQAMADYNAALNEEILARAIKATEHVEEKTSFQAPAATQEVVERDGFIGCVVHESNITYVGYSIADKLVRVEYANGAFYNYQDVPQEVWRLLEAAPSKSKHIAQNFKGAFRYYRANGD